MTRTRSALLVAAVAGLLTLPPLGQRVLAPSDEVHFVIYAQEALQHHAAFDVHVRAKRFRDSRDHVLACHAEQPRGQAGHTGHGQGQSLHGPPAWPFAVAS